MSWLFAMFLNSSNLYEGANELHFYPPIQFDRLSSMILDSFIILWPTCAGHKTAPFLVGILQFIFFHITEVFVRTFNCKFWNLNYNHKLKISNTMAHRRIYAWLLCVYVHLLWELWCAHVLTILPRRGCWQIKQHAHFSV